MVFNFVIRPNEELAKIIGNEDISPTKMIGKIWKYIDKHNLKIQTPKIIKTEESKVC